MEIEPKNVERGKVKCKRGGEIEECKSGWRDRIENFEIYKSFTRAVPLALVFQPYRLWLMYF